MIFVFGIVIILTTIILTGRESCVLGELTILQGAPFLISNNSNVMARMLTCVSEDDSSALVWNEDLRNQNRRESSIEFVDSSTKRNTIDCSFDKKDDCLQRWDITSNWEFTDSSAKPMGPVIDKRWEGFFENSSVSNHYKLRITPTGTNIISFRGTTDLQLDFCDARTGRCHLIAIGGKTGAESFIREYELYNEFREERRMPGTECQRPPVPRKHAESSSWKTLTLKYSQRSKTVTVYDEVEQILSCSFTEWKKFNSLHVLSPNSMLLRQHDYVYLHTTEADEHLLSPWFDVVGSNICIEMDIGLCAECKASVDVISENEHQHTMGDVRSKSNSNGDGLLPWQHVKFNKSVQDSFGNRVQFQIVTHLLENVSTPMWAVANIRICKDDDAVRTSSILSTQVLDRTKNEFSWPEVYCQKLSYNGGSLVRSNSVIQHELKRGMPSCEKGKVGPHCALNCTSISADVNCRNLSTSICLADGCTCSQGWQGENCDEEALSSETRIALAEGIVTFDWPRSRRTYNKIYQHTIIVERIASDLWWESNQEKTLSAFYRVDEYIIKYTEQFYLLPSSIHKFYVAVHASAGLGRYIDKENSKPPALAFENDFRTAGARSDHTIQVELPSISNDRVDSIMHIIVKGEVLCEHRTRVSDVLTSHIGLIDYERAWVAASFKTIWMKEKLFTIGDNRTYNGRLNCPLMPGEKYDIVVIVDGGMKATVKMTIISNSLHVELSGESTIPVLEWLINYPIIAVLVLIIYYVYRSCCSKRAENTRASYKYTTIPQYEAFGTSS